MALQNSPESFLNRRTGRSGEVRFGAFSQDKGFQSQAAQGAGEVGAAAGMSTLSDVHSVMRKNSPKFGVLGQEGMAARSKMRQAAMQAEADVAAAGLQSVGQVRAAEIEAEAMKEAAQAKAQGSMASSAIGMVGSIGAALLSDESTKNTIETIEDALSTLRELKPVSFYYNEEYSSSPDRLHYGFIAQQYARVMPDATYLDEDLNKMCIDTVELIGLLVRAVQQLETKVTRLEAAHALAGVK
jgi:hypothetical protein